MLYIIVSIIGFVFVLCGIIFCISVVIVCVLDVVINFDFGRIIKFVLSIGFMWYYSGWRVFCVFFCVLVYYFNFLVLKCK